ncbi:chromosome segregation protein [Carpediemonas membranifera]|uniref:Chromosome segregation protein n=1 Tax=Carpediemonas membranifera TaxID=201153 RepID=A0A8J6BZR4_9EUKA|nr:chromosome segregation protein [Carpediemonas membranifera]|eukprot:KAG9395796.1 chromosome segregation protein [Carpediemonas membranifera]
MEGSLPLVKPGASLKLESPMKVRPQTAASKIGSLQSLDGEKKRMMRTNQTFSQQQISKLEGALNKLKHAFDMEHADNLRLRKELQDHEIEHLAQMRSVGGIYAGDRRDKAVQKQIQDQADKIEQIMATNSLLLAESRRLKDERDSAKSELNNLKGILKRSDQELATMKRELASVKRQYDQVVVDKEVCAGEAKLQMQRFEKEKELWQSEVREMRQQLESVRRVNTLVSSATKKIGSRSSSAASSLGAPTTISKRTEEILSRIMGDSATDINTGLLNYVNELTVDHEKLSKAMEVSNETISRLKVQASGDRNGTRRLTRMLEDKLSASESLARSLAAKEQASEAHRRAAHASLDRIATTLRLFESDTEFKTERSTPNDSSIMLLLGLIEQYAAGVGFKSVDAAGSKDTMTASVLARVSGTLSRSAERDPEATPKRIMSLAEHRANVKDSLADLRR